MTRHAITFSPRAAENAVMILAVAGLVLAWALASLAARAWLRRTSRDLSTGCSLFVHDQAERERWRRDDD